MTVYRTILLGWTLAGLLIIPISGQAEPSPKGKDVPQPATSAFMNGRWFNGQTFVSQTLYAVNGVLTTSPPEDISTRIDLHGGFVIPPFGEAHTHNVEGEWNIDQVIHQYLRDGVFYVKNPNDISELVQHIRPKINHPGSIDVVFAHAGLTGEHGHPMDLYESILRYHRYETVIGQRPKGWFAGRAYVPVSSLKDFEDRWPAIRATKPDFLKVYLADSGNFEQPYPSAANGFRRGLDPHLLGPIVAFAHRQGLRVSAHVETAADFRLALQEKVDEIAHVPGWFLPELSGSSAVLLTEEDARLAAQQRVVVVTTTVAGHTPPAGHDHHATTSPKSVADPGHHQQHSSEEALRKTARDIQTRNLRLLDQAGVRLAIGSDHAETPLTEALHLHQLGVFDNLGLLKMWCEITPQAIFPSRKIGRLEEGYEASFLVLQNNPLEDFLNVRSIVLRFKQGYPLMDSPPRDKTEEVQTPHG